MSSDSHEDMKKHVRGYMYVFAALIVGTILTVAVAGIDFGHPVINISVGLLIATTKAALVALFFMHLISEKAAIYSLLAFTVFFFTGLMVLTLWASDDFPFRSILW